MAKDNTGGGYRLPRLQPRTIEDGRVGVGRNADDVRPADDRLRLIAGVQADSGHSRTGRRANLDAKLWRPLPSAVFATRWIRRGYPGAFPRAYSASAPSNAATHSAIGARFATSSSLSRRAMASFQLTATCPAMRPQPAARCSWRYAGRSSSGKAARPRTARCSWWRYRTPARR